MYSRFLAFLFSRCRLLFSASRALAFSGSACLFCFSRNRILLLFSAYSSRRLLFRLSFASCRARASASSRGRVESAIAISPIRLGVLVRDGGGLQPVAVSSFYCSDCCASIGSTLQPSHNHSHAWVEVKILPSAFCDCPMKPNVFAIGAVVHAF